VTTAVVGNGAVAVGREEEHLVFEIIAVEGPAVAEDNGGEGGRAPVFVVDLGGVWGCYEWHCGWVVMKSGVGCK